ncbi:MAG: cytoplasmic protein, partial [Acidimicrobiales bacterium]
FEMDQVIPGLEEGDWDCDPVADAAELHRAGADGQATRLLEDLIAQDERCIDAWVHLGNVALDVKGPKAAVGLYDRGVAIAEESLPPDFCGVLAWSLVDNRPFLRALHGLGLCAWRQRRWDDAEYIFLARAWLDGAGTWDAIWCLDQVRARLRWSR